MSIMLIMCGLGMMGYEWYFFLNIYNFNLINRILDEVQCRIIYKIFMCSSFWIVKVIKLKID